MDSNQHKNEDEIDLLELFHKLWIKRKSILKFTLFFFILGIIIALISPKQYTAVTVMIPQTSGDKMSVGGLGGLAAMAGINLGGSSTESIPLNTYPKIVESIPFRKKLIQTPLKFNDLNEVISYEKYCKEYAKPGILGNIKKYTIGLPSLLFGKKNDEKSVTSEKTDSIWSLSLEDRNILDGISGQLAIDIDEKEGIISLSYSMPEALAAAQMLQSTQTLLQETVTEFKTQKANEELKFIEQRYEEAKSDFKAKQFALAQFQDRNRDLFGSLPQTRLEQLQSDYNLSFNVYSELAKQVEAKRIKVKEEHPIFTIVEPVSVPNERSKPKRGMIVAIWTFFGFIIGVSLVFIKDSIKKIKSNNIYNE
ncbi:Wzz/FepE/Etk N-terminal domain-containing protein [Capnocytophaga stomatis]|uniref:Capsule biosynthesis protein n=1 Tax=Capnocytophaga stomatis TaxID=1848904 RepID=A0A250G1Q9_9FLAO|nr:Wzz/FepE/Etk N-terminal domain-containing protein [Capnocytophaga stomatis]ATA90176.1 capsule biosynthesis protein [Capnocytophaga stomatis]GIM49694.1 chain-length determining protein [Capnocytophaga stomatis]